MDIRRPISLAHSVTETYLMFIMPMAPTTKDIAAVAAGNTVKQLAG